jgi:hypothetical protein
MSVQLLQCVEKPFCMNCFNEYIILNTEGKAECGECKSMIYLSECGRNNLVSNHDVNNEISILSKNFDKVCSQLFKKCEHPRIKAIRDMSQLFYY